MGGLLKSNAFESNCSLILFHALIKETSPELRDIKFSTEDLGAGTDSTATDLDWLSFISSTPENAIMALPFLLVCSKCEFVTAASFIVLDMVAENVTFDPNYVDVDRALSIPSSTDITSSLITSLSWKCVIASMILRGEVAVLKAFITIERWEWGRSNGCEEDAMISHASKVPLAMVLMNSILGSYDTLSTARQTSATDLVVWRRREANAIVTLFTCVANERKLSSRTDEKLCPTLHIHLKFSCSL